MELIKSMDDVFKFVASEGVDFKYLGNKEEVAKAVRKALIKMCHTCKITKGIVHWLKPAAVAIGKGDFGARAVTNLLEGYSKYGYNAQGQNKAEWNRNARASAALGKDVDWAEPQYTTIEFNNKGYVEDVMEPKLMQAGIRFTHDEPSRGKHVLTLIAEDTAASRKIQAMLDSLGYKDTGNYRIKSGLIKADYFDRETGEAYTSTNRDYGGEEYDVVTNKGVDVWKQLGERDLNGFFHPELTQKGKEKVMPISFAKAYKRV